MFYPLSTKKTAVDACVLYVQAGGYHLPAEVDSDTVAWHSVQEIWQTTRYYTSCYRWKSIIRLFNDCIFIILRVWNVCGGTYSR